MKTLAALLAILPEIVLHAGPRTSVSYSVSAEAADVAGRRTASANYTNDGSLGAIAGVSTASTPAETAKHGYIGQLYEVTALQLAASPTTINEAGTRQLAGTQWLDDLTSLAVPASSITWSIQSGPLIGIDANGLATAAAVYENTTATARGSYAGNSGTLGLAVLDTIPDNFGSYAGDGISDDWQVQYFGLSNPNAAPLLDPDYDGVLNPMEFATALNPTTASVVPMQTVKNGAALEFTYQRANTALAGGIGFIVEWSDSLTTLDWHTSGVTQTILSDNGTTQQVMATVPAGSSGNRFVHLKVTAPP